ncbi:MAG: AAA family ATPase [Deltaproteobacteria bacterium]|nr:AAA family ATPase [Deltaproteobacteria bacterium]
MPKNHREVPPENLRITIKPEALPFEDTSALEPPTDPVLGQERASDAIKFGIGMKEDGYHIYVAGPPKTGLTYIAKTHLEEQAKKEPTPPDWCYVYNFKEPDRPKSIRLSAGKGKELKKDMAEFIESLKTKIREVFDSDDYRAKENEVNQAFEREKRRITEELAELARQEGFILQISQVGMVIIPAAPDGQPMSQEDLVQLSDEEKKRLREKSDELHEKMKSAIQKIREAETDFKNRRSKLDNEIALYVVDQLLEYYLKKYKDEPGAIGYLKEAKEDILENIDDFKKQPEPPHPQVAQFPVQPKEVVFRKYDVNVLIDNSETKGAPVLVEPNPIYPNLFGTIERQAWFGALFTDFTMIKPGVLHKANGGYLVLKALDLLRWYFSWEALKRALRNREIRIEDLGELYGLFSTKTIRPEPIPLDIKIVLTGDPFLFELLYIYDDRFQKLFKIKAHLDDRMDRKEETILQSAQMIGRFCAAQDIRHLDRSGVARIIEYSMERTEDRQKLTLELADISDLIKEANYFASHEGKGLITREHVEKAIQKRIYRSNLIEERIKELVKDDIFWIETEGSRVGQINGISILMTGDHEFGKPNRITAVVSVGREGVIAIEKESKMSGNIHTKGVLILTSFLKERFGHNKPLSLNATLCFEQSYGLVEGDSASSTELFALLSALANVPINQGIAVTGSVSQKGEIQAVGGVNRKIEAFFDICRHKGLNGQQGVIIPEKNIRNLMLKQEVIDAVKEGKFHIWPISTIEEGIEILTGIEAGAIQPDGTYPEGTLFRKVDERLVEIAELVKRFAKEEEASKKEASNGE